MDGFIIGLTTLKFEFHPVEDFPNGSGESNDVTEGDDRGEFALAAVAMQQFLSDRESEVVVSSGRVRLRSFACVLCPHEISAGRFRVIVAHTCETHDGCGDAYVVVDTLNCHPVAALNIKLLEPLAQGASRFEKLLAPPNPLAPIFFK